MAARPRCLTPRSRTLPVHRNRLYALSTAAMNRPVRTSIPTNAPTAVGARRLHRRQRRENPGWCGNLPFFTCTEGACLGSMSAYPSAHRVPSRRADLLPASRPWARKGLALVHQSVESDSRWHWQGPSTTMTSSGRRIFLDLKVRGTMRPTRVFDLSVSD